MSPFGEQALVYQIIWWTAIILPKHQFGTLWRLNRILGFHFSKGRVQHHFLHHSTVSEYYTYPAHVDIEQCNCNKQKHPYQHIYATDMKMSMSRDVTIWE